MLEPDVVSELLDAFTDSAVARKRGKEVHTLRGVRGACGSRPREVSTAAVRAPTFSDSRLLRFGST